MRITGDPSLSQMAEACARIGTTGCKVSAMATALQPSWKGQQGGKRKQGNAQAGKKQRKKVQKGTPPLFLCGRCGRLNHTANVCKAMVHVNSQALSGSGNGKRSTKGRHTQTQVSFLALEPMEICWADSQLAPAAQQA